MRMKSVVEIVGFLALGICASTSLAAEETVVPRIATTEVHAVPTIPPRIVEGIDEARLIKLAGNIHPLARPEFDLGIVNAQQPMERMVLVLKRSPEQEAALEKFMADQLDPKSSNFHHWLDSKAFGATYGVSEADIAAVSSWLQNHGFRVDDVSNGRIFLHFSGTAAQVQEAFHTEMHRYNVRGRQHLANSKDPSIPEALSPVVLGIESLNDFFATPAHVEMGNYRRVAKTGKWAPSDDNPKSNPLFVIKTGTSQGDFEEVSPYDFATIYNVLALWNAGIDGTGVSIALAGRSDINLKDVATFRAAFGLPANVPQVIVNGPDPGVPSGPDKSENSLDVELSGAVAKGATIKFVTTASTQTADGAGASAMYIIDASPKIASIMSYSYQSCELEEGSAGNSAENSLWQQGAAEGISEFVASGDYGSAQCDGGQTAPYLAQNGLLVSGLSSSPYDTAVGGTDLNWYNSNSEAKYWNATNATNDSNAVSYIPEVPWNQTCASDSQDAFVGGTQEGLDEEQTCQALINDQIATQEINAVGGSGGKSSCTSPTGTTKASCTGGYAKPSWQTGTGVPNDGARDVPDVSLFASANGLYSGYLYCDSDYGPCTFSNNSDAEMQVTGGTSAASPSMAGIMALVLQKTGSAQGLANPVLYQLAAKDNRASCNSNTVTAGNACNFFDVTSDNNAVPCSPGSPDCTVHHAGDTVGIMNGWTAGTGFDLATGLGTVNANNLVNNWPASAAGTPAITLSPTNLTFPATPVGTSNATTQAVTVKNTGTAAATITNIAISGGNYADFSGTGTTTTCSTTTALAVNASCIVTIAFDPAAAGTRASTLVITDNAGSGTQSAALSGTGGTATPAITLSPTSLTFPSTPIGTTNATTQAVTVKNTGTAAVSITNIAISGGNYADFSGTGTTTTCSTTTALAVSASCTVTIAFNPAAMGARSSTLVISDNAGTGTQSAALSGTGASATPSVTLSPGSATYASTQVGYTGQSMNFTLTNNGATTVTGISISISGVNSGSYTSVTGCSSSLSAGASCATSVTFTPQAAGTLTATFNISDSAGTQSVTLSGTGTSPALTVTLSPTTLAFASTTVGSTSAAQAVTIKNTGTASVTLSSETLAGAGASSFLIAANNCTASLAAGASCAVSVEFKPASAASFSASLSVTDNATGTPQVAALSGTGTAATGSSLTITPASQSLTFASTAVGSETSAQELILKNSGTTAITFTSYKYTGANVSSFVQTSSNCSTSLAAGSSCAFFVAFRPQSSGTLSATLNIADNLPGSPQTVALSGTGTGGTTLTVSLSPTSLAFASTTVGSTTAAQAVTVTNSGSGAVALSSETLTGANSASFLISSNTCTTSLAAGASCSVSVEFNPTAAGALTASLSIADNATGTPQTTALSGTGTAATGSTLTITPASQSLTFASTAVGSETSAQEIILKNSGTTAITFTSYKYTGTNVNSFVQTSSNCSTSLAAGASCAFFVAFKPQSSGALSATLNIADNLPGSPQTVALTGTGTGGTAATVTLSLTSLAFSSTVVGTTSAAQVVTVANSGSSSATISSIGLSGTNPTSFVQLNGCGPTLAASSSCVIYIAFTPASAAALSATLSVADTAPGSPQTVALTGTGATAPSVQLSTTSLAFPTTTHGTVSEGQAVTVTNTGTAMLTILGIDLTGSSPASFKQVSTCGSTLAANSSCTVYLAFAPQAAGAVTATLSIIDYGSTTDQTVALSGTGN